jgi:DNA-directed RNA polymerase specialized sigma24 family protein
MTLDPLAANTNDEPAPISERRLIVLLTPRTGRGDTRLAMDDVDDARRRKVLADPALHKAILGIARQRGVPDSDASDVLNDVIEAACKDSNVPLEDFEQTRMYLNAMARHKSIDRARGRKKHMERHVEADDETPGADAATIEKRVLASRLVEEGRNLYPRTHHWFERFAIFGESHAEIAADVKASPARVRHEVSDIRRTLRRVALAGVAAIVVLALGLHKWRRPGTENHDPLAHSATGAPRTPPVPSAPPSNAKPTPPPEAVALRQRAREELARGQWDLCLADIIKAVDLDPSGATPEDAEIMRKANDKLNVPEAKPLLR